MELKLTDGLARYAVYLYILAADITRDIDHMLMMRKVDSPKARRRQRPAEGVSWPIWQFAGSYQIKTPDRPHFATFQISEERYNIYVDI